MCLRRLLGRRPAEPTPDPPVLLVRRPDGSIRCGLPDEDARTLDAEIARRRAARRRRRGQG